MELNDRKIQILQAIIMNYLETAEPVGSRTISRRLPLGLSSATIRNEMSDLEEMGLIVQPHTSAGRIPSTKGYRLYVDHLVGLAGKPMEQFDALRGLLQKKYVQLDSLMKEMGDILAELTKYTAVVAMPQFRKTRIKRLQLVPLDPYSMILVVVADGNIVRNNVIRTRHPLNTEDTYRMSEILNAHLAGRTVDSVTQEEAAMIKQEMQADSTMMEGVWDAISNTLKYAENIDVFTSGATNILNFPEFSDIARARALMEVFHEKDKMLSLVDYDLKDDESMKITIGSENTIEQLKDCSVVTATYKYGGQNIGSISVVGPMRMDYDRVIGTLDYLVKDFQNMFANNEEKEQKESQE